MSARNSPSRLSSLVVTKFNVHDGVLAPNTDVLSTRPGLGLTGPIPPTSPHGGKTSSLSSLVSGLGAPGGGDPSIVPWLGFVQLSMLGSFSSHQADPTSSSCLSVIPTPPSRDPENSSWLLLRPGPILPIWPSQFSQRSPGLLFSPVLGMTLFPRKFKLYELLDPFLVLAESVGLWVLSPSLVLIPLKVLPN